MGATATVWHRDSHPVTIAATQTKRSMAPIATPWNFEETASRGRLLLVEDDPDAAFYTRYVLTGRGRFEVTHTADPAAALTLAAVGSWDLVLTDSDLPGMSSADLIAALRRLVPRIPVLLLAASALNTCPIAARGTRCPDAVLVKPVPAADLLATVSTLVTGQAPPPHG